MEQLTEIVAEEEKNKSLPTLEVIKYKNVFIFIFLVSLKYRNFMQNVFLDCPLQFLKKK